jgi:uncharacterized protein (UPF0303 family)
MAKADDLDKVVGQEKALVLPAFDEAAAFELGKRLREMALERDLPIIVDIRLWDRPLFYAALPRSTGANAQWALRKINSVRLYHKSTYRMFLEQGAKERVFGPDYGHSPADYAIAGGAFPIAVEGLGAIGVAAVSGLPQREDHEFVVAALAAHLGLDGAALALPSQKA